MTKNPARSEYSAGQLRVLLARTGVTGAELGRRLERSRNWVSGRATGTYPITPEDAIAIVRALGAGLSDLLDTPPPRILTRLAPVLAEVQTEVLDDPISTDEEKQWLLVNIRYLMNAVLTSPYRAARRKGR